MKRSASKENLPMTEPILIDINQGIAAVKLRGSWRFFHDDDWMFLLDWGKYRYQPGETPDEDDPRRDTMIVDENNAKEWMSLLAGELMAEQIPNAVYEAGGRVPLRFVIDFDQRLWVGCMWNMDQSALHDYQPDDWAAGEDDVFEFAPKEIARLWER
jgi:hypothetical protein